MRREELASDLSFNILFTKVAVLVRSSLSMYEYSPGALKMSLMTAASIFGHRPFTISMMLTTILALASRVETRLLGNVAPIGA